MCSCSPGGGLRYVVVRAVLPHGFSLTPSSAPAAGLQGAGQVKGITPRLGGKGWIFFVFLHGWGQWQIFF